jgi:hypothetical protein
VGGNTWHFEEEVLRLRPYIKVEWCRRIIANPIAKRIQPDGARQFWGDVPELVQVLPGIKSTIMRVVTLDDEVTIITAFPDRNFERRAGP